MLVTRWLTAYASVESERRHAGVEVSSRLGGVNRRVLWNDRCPPKRPSAGCGRWPRSRTGLMV